jgi:hypothetical protein
MKTAFYQQSTRVPAWLLLAASGLLASPALAQTPASFAPVAPYSTGAGGFPISLAVADVNGDGRPDLLTVSQVTYTAGVQLGTGTGTFGAVTSYSTGGGIPWSIAVADVNGDGKPDLLTANAHSGPADSGTAGVLLGNGDGTFRAVTEFSTGPGNASIGITVADANSDGKLDLLTANGEGYTTSLLLGTGTGSFGAATQFSTGAGSYPYEVAVADVNGDGKPDQLTANANTHTAGVLLGTGNGTFGPITTYSTSAGSAPTDIEVADVNGDGKLDLLTANIFGNAVGVLLGNGNGTFGTVTPFSTGADSSPFKLAVADVNGDGKLDLLTDNRGGDAAGVLLGTGTGSFGTVTPFSTGAGSRPQEIAVADVNGDGKPDLVTANSGTGTAGVLLNTTPTPGNRGFLPVATYSAGAGVFPNSIAVADVNSDGKLDLLTANGPTVGVQLGTGPGTFGTAATYSTGTSGAQSIAVADVNGDGKLDAVTVSFSSSTASVLPGTGTGSFGTAATYSVGAGTQPTSIVIADITGDGKPDLFTANRGRGPAFGGGSVGVLVNTGTGSFSAPSLYSTGSNTQPSSVAVADVNNDGKPDLLTANFDVSGSSPATVGVQLGGRLGTVTLFLIGNDSYPSDIKVADVNGDGKLDVLTTMYDVGAGRAGSLAGVLLGTGTGNFGTVARYSTGESSPTGTRSTPYSLAVADVNGDGKLDLLTANQGTNTVGQLLGTGTGTFGAATTYSTGEGSAPRGIVVADVNGDGKPDLLTANTSTSTTGVLLGTTLVTPTLTSLSPTSGPVGTTVTLTGTDLAGATGVSFNGTAATTFSVVNSTTITATVPAGASTGAVSVTAPGSTATGPTFTVITDLVVTTTTTIQPGTYTSLTVNSPGVGTLAGNVTVSGSVSVNSGATLNDGCAVISGAGSFTLAAGGTLGICNVAGISSSGATGAVQTTGTRSFSPDASYVYNGTAAQSTGSGLPGQVRNLSTTNANTVTLATATSVAQVLTVGAAGNLALNGNALTLLSTSAGTALAVNAGSGIVSGNTAVVQRYIDGSLNSGRGYRHYSVPVTGTTLADFTTSGFTPVLNPAYNSSPTPATVTPFPTLYIYNQSALATRTNNLSAFDKGWLSPSSLTDGATPGLGYCVNISAGQVVDLVGTLYNTPLTVGMSRTTGATAAQGGWALLGNPYPAPLDLSLVQNADRVNLDAAIYVVQSTGPYAGGYRAYVNGVSTSASNSPLLALGQGFFARVRAGQTTGSFTFRNTQRVTSYASQAAFQRTAADPRPAVRLELAGAGLADGWVAYVETGATPAFDSQLDAGKLPNSTGLNLSSVAGAENLAIDGRPAFTAATVLPLAVGVPAAGTYTLAATALNNLPAGLDAYLRDAQTGQVSKLSVGTSYAFSATAAEAQALLVGRFTLQFSAASPLATTAALTAAEVTVYPNPAHGSFAVAVPAVAGASQVQAELRSALGQVVRTQAAALPAAGARLTVATDGLAAGVYVLRLTAGPSTIAKRVVIQ